MLVVVASCSHSSCNCCDSRWTLATVLWLLMVCACFLQHCGTLLSATSCRHTWWLQMLAVATRCPVDIWSSRPRSTIASVRHDYLFMAAPMSKTLQRPDVYSSFLFFVPPHLVLPFFLVFTFLTHVPRAESSAHFILVKVIIHYCFIFLSSFTIPFALCDSIVLSCRTIALL